jgi:endonuclease V-like protein UPF0215 family
MFRKIKKEIRIVGWDDAPFTFRDRKTPLVGVICRGGFQIDGVISAEIRVDGTNSTDALIKAVKKTKHYSQLRLVMLDGITFGGFNVVDIRKLSKRTGLPVLVVIRDKPNLVSIRKSLARFRDSEKRWKLIASAGEIKKHSITNSVLKGKKTIYYQSTGLTSSEAEEILNLTSVHSVTPEPIRIAHMIGYGMKNIKAKKTNRK